MSPIDAEIHFALRASSNNGGQMKTLVVTARAGGSSSQAVAGIGDELQAGLGGRKPAFVMVFAFTAQPLGEIMGPLTARFAPSVVLGSSTAGEFVASGDSNSTVVAVAVAGDFKVFGGMATGLRASASDVVEKR